MKKLVAILAFFLPVFVFGTSILLSKQSERWLVIPVEAAGLTGQAVAGADIANADQLAKERSVAPETYFGPIGPITLSEMLQQLQVTANAEDIVTAVPDPQLGRGSVIRIYRAQVVLVKDGNKEELVRTWQPTVKQLLEERKIELGEQDKIEPGQESNILTNERTKPVVVTITRVEETDVIDRAKIEYQTVEQNDNTLEKGTTKVSQAGANGIREKTYHLRRENGEEVSRKLIKDEVTKKPVSKIILKGTKILVYGTGTATWYTKSLNHVAANNNIPRGTKVKVVNTSNGQSTIVTVVGGGLAGALIDLSYDAFTEIGSPSAGRLPVRVEKVY
ncbi:MAG: G5 domain-containing protein [bacterium]|nr:G5 domain-containing protein [bacterium]